MKSKKSSSSQFTAKLFKGLKLKKRNPRKSLISADQSKSSVPDNSVNSETDSRNSLLDGPCADAVEENGSDLVFDCPNVKITAGKSFISSDPVNILRDAETVSKTRSKINNKLDGGWLERCNRICNLEMQHPVPSSSEEVVEKQDSGVNCDPCSDEDYIYSSDDESCRKVNGLHLLRKSFSDEGMMGMLY